MDFYSSTPNLLRYQIVSPVSLSLGGDQIYAPTEGGVYPVIPRAALVP